MKRILAALALLCLPALATAQPVDPTGSKGSFTPPLTASGTLGALNAAVTLNLNGREQAGYTIVSTDLDGTVVFEQTMDGGTTWVAVQVADRSYNNDELKSNLSYTGAPSTEAGSILSTAGAVQVRLRVSVYNSGSATAKVVASTATDGRFVNVASVQGQITVDSINTIDVSVTPGTGATHLGKAEDAAAASGGTGVAALIVQKATPADLAGDGDYALPQMSGGRLWASTLIDTALPAGNNNIGDVDVATVPVPLSTTGGGTEATALRVTVANDSTGLLSVDDNGGSLTVDTPQLPVALDGANLKVHEQGTVPVTGPLTDAQLRATPVPISGTVTVTDGAGALNVIVDSGAITETNSGAIKTAVEIMDDWDESDRAKVNPIVGQTGVAANSGDASALTQRVIHAGIATIATGQTSCATTATQIVAARAGRQAINVTQVGTTVVYLGTSDVATTTGDYLAGVAGTSRSLPISSALYCIVASGTQTVSWTEAY